MPLIPFFRYADTNGDGSGTKNANVNGAITPQVFKTGLRSDDTGLELHRMIVFIRDTGTFDAEKYGNEGVLTNGITVALHDPDGSERIDLCDGVPIRSNADWSRLCYDVSYQSQGVGDEFAVVRWTFARTGNPLFLKQGSELRITINDNLTGLVEHYFQLQGLSK